MAGVSVKIACMLVVCMMVAAPYTEAAISCGTVVSSLSPCISYLQKGGAPSSQCCAGVKSLNNAAKTTPDRQSACSCLKSASSQFKVNGALAAGLPKKCGVIIPYTISPSTDCSKVK